MSYFTWHTLEKPEANNYCRNVIAKLYSESTSLRKNTFYFKKEVGLKTVVRSITCTCTWLFTSDCGFVVLPTFFILQFNFILLYFISFYFFFWRAIVRETKLWFCFRILYIVILRVRWNMSSSIDHYIECTCFNVYFMHNSIRNKGWASNLFCSRRNKKRINNVERSYTISTFSI